METANILVIEDDEIVARTIERSLRGHEFRVTIANSGVEGQKIARRQVTDLIILDVIMPGMDGYTVCRQIRADPLLSEIPILFLTAKARDEDKITGFLAGADDYITKPFNIEELILRIRAILKRGKNKEKSDVPAMDAIPDKGSEIESQMVIKRRDQSLKHQLKAGDFVLN